MSTLSTWLRSTVDTCSSNLVEFKASPLGGLGGFAKESIPAGAVLFDIPREFVLSSACSKVLSHPLVRDLAKDLEITAETLLFVYMILRRLKANEHDDEDGYLASLPLHPPLLVADELLGTNVGSQISLDHNELQMQLERIHFVKGLEFITVEDLMIAKYNYNSRRYPFYLAAMDEVAGGKKLGDPDGQTTTTTTAASSEDGEVESLKAAKKRRLSGGVNSNQQHQPQRRVYDETQGALVPLLDVLNHSPPPQGMKRVVFDTSIPNIVRVKTGVAYVKSEEIYSDYGCISNDQCLLQFGYFDPCCKSVYTVLLGGKRYDLYDGAEFSPELVADGGYGLSKHLSTKLSVLLQAKASSNTNIAMHMVSQKALLETLILQCEAYADEEEDGDSEEEENISASDGDEDVLYN